MRDSHGEGKGFCWRSKWWSRKERTLRGRVSHTQYLESQKGQDIIRLFYFTKTQERRIKGVFVLWN